MEKVWLEVDAQTGQFKAKFADASGTVKQFGNDAVQQGTKASKGIDRATDSTEKLNRGLTGVRNTLAGAFVTAGIIKVGREILNTSDRVLEMGARLKVATTSTAEYNRAQEETFAISQRTSAALGDTVELYSRLSLSLKDVEVTQREVFNITETVQKAFTISGASAQEASNAIRQLSQSMSAGVLRGDEFRSVMEQGSRVASVLTDSLGVTRGELKRMADDGELSAEIVTKALLEQSQVINQEFANFPITVSRAIQQMSNSWTKYIAESETAAEVSATVAEVILSVSENMDTLIASALTMTQVAIALAGARGLKALQASLVATTAAKAAATKGTYSYASAMGVATVSVGKMTKATRGLFAFLKSNALGIAIFGGIELIQFIGDLIDGAEEFKNANLPESVRRVNEAFKEGFGAEQIQNVRGELGNLQKDLDSLEQKLTTQKEAFASASAGGVRAADRYIYAAQANKKLEDQIEATTEAMNKLTAANLVDSTLGAWIRAAQEYEQSLRDQEKAIEDTNADLDKWIENQREGVEALRIQNEAFGKGQAALVRLQAEQVKARATSKKYRDEIDKVTDAKIEQIEANEDLKAAEKTLGDAYKATMAVIQNYRADVDPVLAAQIEMSQILANASLALDAGTISQQEFNTAVEAAKKVVADANAELDAQASKVRTVDDVLEDLGVTNKGVEADILLLRDALAQANANMDTAAAEKYAEALRLLGDGARSASQVENVGSLVNTGGNVLSAFVNGGDAGDAFISSLEGVFSSAVSSFSTAFTSAFSAGGGIGASASAGFAAVPVVGWIAAGVLANMNLYEDGWQLATAELNDLGNVALLASRSIIKGLEALGINSKWAEILSGAPLLTALFGRKAPEIERQGFNATLSRDGLSGESFADIIRKGGLFRSDRRYTETAELSEDVIDQFTILFDTIEELVRNVTRDIQSDYEGFVEGTFNQTFNKKGDLIGESSTVRGVTREEDFDAFVARLTAENILAALSGATEQIETIVNSSFDITGDYGDVLASISTSRTVMVSELELLAENYRETAEDLLDFALFAQAEITNIANGEGLTGSITQTTEIVESLRKGSEALVNAYTRIYGSTILTEQALETMGVQLDLAREEFIVFATEISEAAGGLERAGQLWAEYFENFYSAQELTDVQLGRARENSAESLAEVGLSGNTSLAEFREAFEGVINTLTPAEIVTWLEAGDALATYNNLLEASVAALNEANAAFSEAIGDVNQDIQEIVGSDFQNALAEIQRQEAATIATLNDLAIAAGRAGASEAELGRVHLRTALQTEAAIAQLRLATQSLIDQLYGDQIDQRIAELEALQSNGISNVGQAAENTYERQLALIRRIRDVVDATRIDATLSTLTRQEQLAEGVSQFQDLIAAAQNGDTDALAQLPALYQELLGIGRDVFASGQGYTDLYNQLTSALEGLEPVGSPTGPQPVTIVGGPSAELQALYAERDARDLAAQESQRVALAAQLAEHLNQLAGAIGTPLFTLAETMGVSLSALVADLGVNLSDLTVASVDSLANISNTLGVELVDLAGNIGVELGTLADRQSLLNDALEGRINALPEEFRNNLAPLLTAVENAADGTERDAALAALEAATGGLPVEYRNQLAPFFTDIDPVSQLEEQIGIANRMETAAELRRLLMVNQLGVMESIRNNLRAQNSDAGLPSYAVGTPYVERDQIAKIHEGEMILPKPVAAMLRNFDGKDSGRISSSDTIRVLNELVRVTSAAGVATNQTLEQIRDNTDSRTGKNPAALNLPNLGDRKQPGFF